MVILPNCVCCGGGGPCGTGFDFSDPLDEGQWFPSGEWFDVPFAGQTTVTGTFNPAARGKVWFFYGDYATSNATGNATVAEQEDYENPCNWWSYMSSDPFQLSGNPILGSWRRATSLPTEDATVFFRTRCVWTGTKTLAAAYFMGANLTGDLTCTGSAHDSPGGVVFCNAGPEAGVTLNSGATFGPGTIRANSTINGNVSLRATSGALNPNYVNGDMATGQDSTPNVNGSQITGSLSIQYRGTFTNIVVGGDVIAYGAPQFTTPSITGTLTTYGGTVDGGTVQGACFMYGGSYYNPTIQGHLTMYGGMFYGAANSGITATGGTISPPTTTTTINASTNAVIGGTNSNLDHPNALITASQITISGGLQSFIYRCTLDAPVTIGGDVRVGTNRDFGQKPVRFLQQVTFNDSSSASYSAFHGGPVTFNDSTSFGQCQFGILADPSVTVSIIMNGNSQAGASTSIYGTAATITFNDNACTTTKYYPGQYCPAPNNSNVKGYFGVWGSKQVCNTTAPSWDCTLSVQPDCGCDEYT